MQENFFYTVIELQNLFRVSRGTILHLIKDKGLPAYKIGRSYRINKSDLDNWLDLNRTALKIPEPKQKE